MDTLKNTIQSLTEQIASYEAKPSKVAGTKLRKSLMSVIKDCKDCRGVILKQQKDGKVSKQATKQATKQTTNETVDTSNSDQEEVVEEVVDKTKKSKKTKVVKK